MAARRKLLIHDHRCISCPVRRRRCRARITAPGYVMTLVCQCGDLLYGGWINNELYISGAVNGRALRGLMTPLRRAAAARVRQALLGP